MKPSSTVLSCEIDEMIFKSVLTINKKISWKIYPIISKCISLMSPGQQPRKFQVTKSGYQVLDHFGCFITGEIKPSSGDPGSSPRSVLAAAAAPHRALLRHRTSELHDWLDLHSTNRPPISNGQVGIKWYLVIDCSSREREHTRREIPEHACSRNTLYSNP